MNDQYINGIVGGKLKTDVLVVGRRFHQSGHIVRGMRESRGRQSDRCGHEKMLVFYVDGDDGGGWYGVASSSSTRTRSTIKFTRSRVCCDWNSISSRPREDVRLFVRSVAAPAPLWSWSPLA